MARTRQGSGDGASAKKPRASRQAETQATTVAGAETGTDLSPTPVDDDDLEDEDGDALEERWVDPTPLGEFPTFENFVKAGYEDNEIEFNRRRDAFYERKANEANGDPSQRMPAYASPGPKAADISPPPHAGSPATRRVAKVPAASTVPSKPQSLAGKYVALARLNRDGLDPVAPNSTVTLTHEEAEHFLKHKVVQSLAVRRVRAGDVALPDDQDLGGVYIAKARLKHDDDDQSTLPGEKIVLTDAQARHYLKTGSVESITGL